MYKLTNSTLTFEVIYYKLYIIKKIWKHNAKIMIIIIDN